MQNLSRLELTDIPFVLSERELLKVSVFSVHATIAISLKRAAIQISLEVGGYKNTVEIPLSLCYCKRHIKEKLPLPWQNLYPTESNTLCVAFISGERA